MLMETCTVFEQIQNITASMDLKHIYSGVAAFFAEVLGFTDHLALWNVFALFQRTNTIKHHVPNSSKNVFFSCLKASKMDL